MAKSSKKSKEIAAAEISSPAPSIGGQNGNGAGKTTKPARAESEKPKAKKAAAKTKATGKSRATAPRKSTVSSTPRATATKPATGQNSVSDEEIRTRAYFIAQQRMREGRAADSAHDWLEAQRQLQEETSQGS